MQNLDLSNFNSSFISSREIAIITGKRHDHILRDCDKLNENYGKLGLPKIGEGYYTLPNTGNQQHREMQLTKMQSMDLMTGYKIDLRIKVNRRWEQLETLQVQNHFQIPKTFAEALRLAATTAEENERLQIENTKLHARTDFIDVVFESKDLLSSSEVCKVLQLSYGNKTLYKKFRENGIFFKNKNEPKQSLVDRGYFKMKEVLINDEIKLQTLFTQKGLAYIAKILGIVIPKNQRVKFLN